MRPRTKPMANHRSALPSLLCRRALCGYQVALLLLISSAAHAQVASPYYPTRDSWERRAPEQAGFDAVKLRAAVEFAQASESDTRTDAASIMATFAREPFNAVIGPVKPRGRNSGLVIRHGYIVAEWGDTHRADMTFSATKSYLSTVAGLAFDAGRLRSTQDTVGRDVAIPEFQSAHNARITWHQLLNQTSEWQGTLWDKPDWADRYNPERGKREVQEPGSAWTYNDVRVNVLALALLHVWRTPLPQVLQDKVMEPIGASDSWRWYGYDNSWVELDGRRMPSVSGGGHWGGGMQISARDHARFGYLFLRNGKWRSRQLISEQWIAQATSPTDVRPDYGYLWWLNSAPSRHKMAPASVFWAAGNGGNYVFIDRQNDLLIVLQWTRDFNGVIERVYTALR
jgi:CubicO group peptidase (beta-lactamase class C family)